MHVRKCRNRLGDNKREGAIERWRAIWQFLAGCYEKKGRVVVEGAQRRIQRTAPNEPRIFQKYKPQRDRNSLNFCRCRLYVDKSTSITGKMYHWEVSSETSGGTCKPTGTAVLSFPPSFQGSTPRLLMHLPVSTG